MKKLFLVLLVVSISGLFATDGDLRNAYFSDIYKNLLIVKNSAKTGLDAGLEKLTDGYGNESKFLISAGASQTDDIAISLDTKYKFSWRDNALVMYSSADGQLDIDADAELEFDIGRLDINATDDITIDVSSALKTIQIGETNGVAVNLGSTTSDVTAKDDFYVDGDADVDGTTNLDVVDIDGAVTQNGGTFTINSAGGNYDTIIKGNTDNELITVDASADKVGISTNAPSHTLDVDGTFEVTGATQLTGAVVMSSTLATGGKLTAGANEIECTNVDIGGGDITSTPISGSTGSFTTFETTSTSKFGDTVAMQGNKLDLDADNDTSITADTDDQIDFEVGNADELVLTPAALYPSSDGGLDLGLNASREWQSIYLLQDVDCEDDLVVGDDATIGGNASIASMSTIAAFNYAASVGISDTYTATLTPALGSYITGFMVILNVNTNNTGACSLNLNGLGAVNIKIVDAGVLADPADNDIDADGIAILVYNGTNFILINPIEDTI